MSRKLSIKGALPRLGFIKKDPPGRGEREQSIELNAYGVGKRTSEFDTFLCRPLNL
jgi:hypothetical protein